MIIRVLNFDGFGWFHDLKIAESPVVFERRRNKIAAARY